MIPADDPMTAPCAKCGKVLPLEQLDAKPASLAGRPTTLADLHDAADGEDFGVLECQNCYGPAFACL